MGFVVLCFPAAAVDGPCDQRTPQCLEPQLCSVTSAKEDVVDDQIVCRGGEIRVDYSDGRHRARTRRPRGCVFLPCAPRGCGGKQAADGD